MRFFRPAAHLALHLAAALVATAPVAATAADFYECAMRDSAAVGNWIAPDILFLHEPGAAEARVRDGIIDFYLKKQDIPARVVAENDKRITFAWDVIISVSGMNANVGYRLTYLKATGAVTATAQAAGYVGPFTSQGRCTVKTAR